MLTGMSPKPTTPSQWTCVWPKFGEAVELAAGGLMPSHGTAVYVDEANGLGITLTVEVEVGEVVFKKVEIAERPSAEPITPATLRKLDWALIFERVRFYASTAATAGLRLDRGEGIASELSTITPAQARSIERVAEGDLRRRSVTDELLRRVAEIAVADRATPTKTVAAQLHTSHRNATRWIATARKRGFLADGFSEDAIPQPHQEV